MPLRARVGRCLRLPGTRNFRLGRRSARPVRLLYPSAEDLASGSVARFDAGTWGFEVAPDLTAPADSSGTGSDKHLRRCVDELLLTYESIQGEGDGDGMYGGGEGGMGDATGADEG